MEVGWKELLKSYCYSSLDFSVPLLGHSGILKDQILLTPSYLGRPF